MMRRAMSCVAAGAVLCVAAVPVAALAEAAPYHPPAKRVSPADGFAATVRPTGPTPRAADGHPDLTGIWNGGFTTSQGRTHIRSIATLEPDQAAMQRGNTWNRPLYKPQFWEKVHGLDFSTVEVDPDFSCSPKGVPRMGAPQQIIQTPKQIVLLNGDITRIVPMDGRARDPLDSDFDNWNGLPLGHWEGDVLVVESVGFNDLSWIQWPGFFHTNKMSVTERLERKGDLLFYQFTVNDPEVLAQPWISDRYVRRLNPDPLARVDEVAPCHEQDLKEIADKTFRG